MEDKLTIIDIADLSPVYHDSFYDDIGIKAPEVLVRKGNDSFNWFGHTLMRFNAGQVSLDLYKGKNINDTDYFGKKVIDDIFDKFDILIKANQF